MVCKFCKEAVEAAEARKLELSNMVNTNTYIPSGSSTHTYETIYNGYGVLEVDIDDGLKIYQMDLDEHYNRSRGKCIFRRNKIMGHWSGFDPSYHKMDGSSILVKLDELTYIFVGYFAIEFKTQSPIKDFVSFMGKNGMVYPIAFTDDLTYYLDEQMYEQNHELSKPGGTDDLIQMFYGNIPGKHPVFDFEYRALLWGYE